jgi:hypothetical protein
MDPTLLFSSATASNFQPSPFSHPSTDITPFLSNTMTTDRVAPTTEILAESHSSLSQHHTGVVDSMIASTVDDSASHAFGGEFPSLNDNEEIGEALNMGTQQSGAGHTDAYKNYLDPAGHPDSGTSRSDVDMDVDNSMMAATVDGSASHEQQGDGSDEEFPSLDANDNDDIGGSAGTETVQSGVGDINMHEDGCDEHPDTEDISSNNMDITPEKGTHKTPETPPQKERSLPKNARAKTAPSREQSPPERPRKRKRTSIKLDTESDEDGGDGDEDDSDRDEAGASASNPIDVDLYASIWEPKMVTEPVSI